MGRNTERGLLCSRSAFGKAKFRTKIRAKISLSKGKAGDWDEWNKMEIFNHVYQGCLQNMVKKARWWPEHRSLHHDAQLGVVVFLLPYSTDTLDVCG